MGLNGKRARKWWEKGKKAARSVKKASGVAYREGKRYAFAGKSPRKMIKKLGKDIKTWRGVPRKPAKQKHYNSGFEKLLELKPISFDM